MLNPDEITVLLGMAPVQRGLAGLVISGIGLPVVGVFIIGLDIYAVRFAAMHTALLGLALGLLAGVSPMGCAIALCAGAGALLAPLSARPGGAAGATGFLMTVTVALAFLVLSLSGVNANAAFELLWGSILATGRADLYVLGGLSVLTTGLFFLRRRDLSLILFDREVALCCGVNVDRTVFFLFVLIFVAVGASIRLTGALLVDAVTVLPALAARNLGHSLGSVVALATLLGVTGNLLGFVASILLDLPPGPVLVMVAGAITLCSYGINMMRKPAQ